jgi:DNA polymerase-3 subunit gamma/tau
MADPRTFADAVQLFSERREPVLYAHLRQSARVVRFEPGRIEVALDGDAPPRLAADLGTHLSRWTGRRWVVAVSGAAGQSTLAEQADEARAARRAEAEKVPLVREILDAFPGAEITDVNDPGDIGETGE